MDIRRTTPTGPVSAPLRPPAAPAGAASLRRQTPTDELHLAAAPVKKESGGFFSGLASAVGGGVSWLSDNVGEAIGGAVDWAEKKVNSGIDVAAGAYAKPAQWVADKTRDVPILNHVTRANAWVATQAGELLGGVAKGATTMVAGVGKMVAHPLDTVKGLYAMAEHIPMLPVNPLRMLSAGYDITVNGKDPASTMLEAVNPLDMLGDSAQFGKALVRGITEPYAASINEGKYAEAVGRGIFDIGSLVLTAGAGGAAKGAASVADDAARLANVADDAARVAGLADDASRVADDAARIARYADEVEMAAHIADDVARLAEGTPVVVRRSSGMIDEGWRVEAQLPNGRVRVGKPGAGYKDVPQADLIRQNPRLLQVPEGTAVSVRRTSGAVDEGWRVQSQTPEGHFVLTKDGMSKHVPADELLQRNPHLADGPPVVEVPAVRPDARLVQVPEGTAVSVRRTSGAIDEGWRVDGQLPDGRYQVSKGPMAKTVSADELFSQNPGLAGAPAAPRPLTAAEQARGVAQGQDFARSNRVQAGQQVLDGYVDGGRGMRLGPDGQLTSSREMIVVDRTRDAALRQHLDVARSLKHLPEEQRAQALLKYVDEVMSPQGRHQAVGASEAWSTAKAGQEVLLGDVAGLGGGVCRHRALMYKVLGDEAGLRVDLVRGKVQFGTAGGAHAWNEVVLGNGKQVLVDVMNPSPGYAMPELAQAPALYIDGQGNRFGQVVAQHGY